MPTPAELPNFVMVLRLSMPSRQVGDDVERMVVPVMVVTFLPDRGHHVLSPKLVTP